MPFTEKCSQRPQIYIRPMKQHMASDVIFEVIIRKLNLMYAQHSAWITNFCNTAQKCHTVHQTFVIQHRNVIQYTKIFPITTLIYDLWSNICIKMISFKELYPKTDYQMISKNDWLCWKQVKLKWLKQGQCNDIIIFKVHNGFRSLNQDQNFNPNHQKRLLK